MAVAAPPPPAPETPAVAFAPTLPAPPPPEAGKFGVSVPGLSPPLLPWVPVPPVHGDPFTGPQPPPFPPLGAGVGPFVKLPPPPPFAVIVDNTEETPFVPATPTPAPAPPVPTVTPMEPDGTVKFTPRPHVAAPPVMQYAPAPPPPPPLPPPPPPPPPTTRT